MHCLARILAPISLSIPLLTASAQSPDYPEARRSEQVDVLHHTKIADPYRWMEDVDSAETRAWVAAQQALTRKYLDSLPDRDRLLKRLTEAQNYDKHGIPRRVAGRLFYTKKKGLQNQSVHYWRNEEEGSEEHLLLDANALSEDGTVSVSGTSISDDGRLFAYAISKSGSDWTSWRVRDVATGEDLPDELKWVKFSGATWAPDGSGFYYGRYDAPEEGGELKDTNLNQKLYFHTLGEPQVRDRLVYARPDHPKWGFNADITDDERYLILHVWEGAGSKNALFYQDRDAGDDSPFVELFADFDARYDVIGNNGPIWFVQTDRDAPKGRLLAVDLTKPEPENWRTLIPESEATLQSVSYLAGRFIALYMVDAHDEIRFFRTDGTADGRLETGEIGSIIGFRGRQRDHITYYSLSGFTHPGALYRFDVTKRESTLFWKAQFPIDLSPYRTTQHFFTSKDGTRVPLFLTRRRDAPRNGNVPTILYGYGGFNVSLSPMFSPSVAVWLEQGGAYAVVNLRGGGEYGESWHEGGMKHRKQNVFDDFIAAAEYLIAENYASKETLAISGGSNGGLLVAAVVNQRPDLFGAAAPSVGVMDMLRFHKFTIGWAWQDEYGSPEDAEDFAALKRYSPYHNVQYGKSYPPVLIATADHDDRVFPAHSFKYGAAMQWAQAGNAPILLRIESKAGHGAGTPTTKIIEAAADEQAFFLQYLRKSPQ
jgi:prolyl oligopeptidase